MVRSFITLFSFFIVIIIHSCLLRLRRDLCLHFLFVLNQFVRKRQRREVHCTYECNLKKGQSNLFPQKQNCNSNI